jgi:hypothetical protein
VSEIAWTCRCGLSFLVVLACAVTAALSAQQVGGHKALVIYGSSSGRTCNADAQTGTVLYFRTPPDTTGDGAVGSPPPPHAASPTPIIATQHVTNAIVVLARDATQPAR